MPIIVVEQEKDLDSVLARVLTARVSKAVRERAVAAVRAANPGIDFAAIRPGLVLRIPTLEGARANDGDALGGSIDELAGQLERGLAGLAGLVRAAELADKAEADGMAEVFRSADIKRAAAQDQQLKADLGELKKAMAEDARLSEQQAAAVREALPAWAADLGALRSR